MNWIDIFCLVCILVLTAIGVWRGFLKDMFRLIAWAAAIAGAYFAQSLLADMIARNLEISGFTVKLLCICIGFLVPFLTLFMIAHFVQNAVADTPIGKINRIFGGLLGACKGWVLCFIGLSILHILPVSGDLHDSRNGSFAYKIYRSNLELFGFSSEEVDLIGMAEKKASELSKEITDKAVEKVKGAASEAAEQAKDAATQAVMQATDKAAKEAIQNAKDAAVNTAKQKTEKAASTTKETADPATPSK